MAVDTIRSALEFRHLSDAGFINGYAGEFGWLTTSVPGQTPNEVAQNLVAMFKRHGDSVRDIFIRATQDQAAALVDKSLPESCLLRIAHEDLDLKRDREPIESPPSSAKVEKVSAIAENLAEPAKILLAVDEVKKRILIEGISALKLSTDFRIVSILVRLHEEDRDAGLLPENYRLISATDLAEMASSRGDTTGRKAISRLRDRINREFSQLYGGGLDLDAIIQNVHGKGYRLNPTVYVVAPKVLQRR
jgi:hypothetical protein